MDEFNVKKMNLKLLNFLRDFEGKNITFNDISEVFSYSELMKSLDTTLQSGFIDLLSKVELAPDFQEMINDRTREYLEEENYDEFMLLASDEIILDGIRKYKSDFPDWSISYLKTDESLVEALKLTNHKKNYERVENILFQMQDDNLKFKYLSLLSKQSLPSILATIKDEKIIEQVIDKYPGESGRLVDNIEQEGLRVYYYERNFKKLDAVGKQTIFKGLSEENQAQYLDRYWKKLTDEEKVMHIAALKNKELLLEKTELITSDFDKIKLIGELRHKSLKLSSNEQQEIIKRIEKTIKYDNPNQLVKRIISEEIYYVVDSLNVDKLFVSASDRQIKKFSHNVTDETFLLILSSKENFNEIELVFNHFEDTPSYDSKLNPFIIRYAKEYNLNPEHLIKIAQLSGIDILKNIKNERIQKLVNLDEANFERMIELFDKDKHKMDSTTLNDHINIFLQREFKFKNQDIINISSHIRQGIQTGNHEKVLSLMGQIIGEYDISKTLENHQYTQDDFIKDLIKSNTPNEKTINCLLSITNGYIVHKRNEYIQNNIELYQKKFSKASIEPKFAQKFVIENMPLSMIKETVFNPEFVDLNSGYSEEEVNLVNNPEIIDNIIKFRRNPSNFTSIPDDVKQYLPCFDKLFAKRLPSQTLRLIPDGELKLLYTPVIYINDEIIRDILCNLDVECLKEVTLNDEKIYSDLKDTLTKYKLLGVSDTMRETFVKEDLWVDGLTLSSLINSFPVIHEDLNEKLNKGEITNITLPSILDMAQCYSLDSNKLTTVFGQDNMRFISSNPGPNSSVWNRERRIGKAQEYLEPMYKRTEVSVPSNDVNLELSSGKCMNVVIGNVSDPINLTYGERTGACMRMGGHADDLFDFCLTNENGFHIRFSNPEDDKFVSRVSGFRNGNTVFLNELRFSEDPRYTNDEVKEACINISKLLIEQTKNSKSPIENVVVSCEYVMEKSQRIDLKVSDIKSGIGEFYTDVSTENATILATSNSDNSLVPVKLGNRGVEKYPVQRSKIKAYEGKEAIERMERIEIIDQLLSGKKIEDAETKFHSDVMWTYCGEDWYIKVSQDGLISEYVMENSKQKERALAEKQNYLNLIQNNLGNQNLTNNNEQSISTGVRK